MARDLIEYYRSATLESLLTILAMMGAVPQANTWTLPDGSRVVVGSLAVCYYVDTP